MCWRNKESNRSMFREAARHGCYIVRIHTTVLSPVADILEISILRCIYKNGNFRYTGIFHTLVDPGRKISDKVLEKNSFKRDEIENSPKMDLIYPLLKGFLGDHPFLVCYTTFGSKRLENLYLEHEEKLTVSGILDLRDVCKDVLCEVDTPDYKFQTMTEIFHVEESMEKGNVFPVFQVLHLMNALMEKLKDDTAGTKYARVYGITYRPGFQGMSRIYVNTTEGTVFYDCIKDKWMPKEKGGSLVRELDMQKIEDQVFHLAGCTSYEALKRFRGEAGYEKS